MLCYGIGGECVKVLLNELFCRLVHSTLPYCRNMIPTSPIGTLGEASLSCRWCHIARFIGLFFCELILSNFEPTNGFVFRTESPTEGEWDLTDEFLETNEVRNTRLGKWKDYEFTRDHNKNP